MKEYNFPLNIKLEVNNEIVLEKDKIVLQNEIYLNIETNPTLVIKEDLESLIEKQIKYQSIAGEGNILKVEDKAELELYLLKIEEIINRAREKLNNMTTIKKSP